jgi:hypothetical protein
MSAKNQQGLADPGGHFVDLVPEEVIAGYTKVFMAGRIPKESAAEFLGDSQLMEELVKWGMAHVVPHTALSPPSFRAVSPDLVPRQATFARSTIRRSFSS